MFECQKLLDKLISYSNQSNQDRKSWIKEEAEPGKQYTTKNLNIIQSKKNFEALSARHDEQKIKFEKIIDEIDQFKEETDDFKIEQGNVLLKKIDKLILEFLEPNAESSASQQLREHRKNIILSVSSILYNRVNNTLLDLQEPKEFFRKKTDFEEIPNMLSQLHYYAKELKKDEALFVINQPQKEREVTIDEKEIKKLESKYAEIAKQRTNEKNSILLKVVLPLLLLASALFAAMFFLSGKKINKVEAEKEPDSKKPREKHKEVKSNDSERKGYKPHKATEITVAHDEEKDKYSKESKIKVLKRQSEDLEKKPDELYKAFEELDGESKKRLPQGLRSRKAKNFFQN